MKKIRFTVLARTCAALVVMGVVIAQQKKGDARKPPTPLPDAAQEAQTPRTVAKTRPEQQKTPQDADEKFLPAKAPPVNPAVKDQPKGGQITGFDFSRDPLNADKPMQTLAEIMQLDKAAKAEVM